MARRGKRLNKNPRAEFYWAFSASTQTRQRHYNGRDATEF